MLPQEYDGIFKLIIIGTSGVGIKGKSSLLNQFYNSEFQEKQKTTIGVDLKIKTKKMENGKVLKLQLYDTAGQEKFKSIVSAYYKGAHGVVLVYDVTNKNSFEDIQVWYDDICQYAKQNVEIILIGNKIDLKEQRMVTTEEGKKLSEELECYFMETSAKDHINVEQAFDVLTKEIYEKELQIREKIQQPEQNQEKQKQKDKGSEKIEINQTTKKEEKESKCC